MPHNDPDLSKFDDAVKKHIRNVEDDLRELSHSIREHLRANLSRSGCEADHAREPRPNRQQSRTGLERAPCAQGPHRVHGEAGRLRDHPSRVRLADGVVGRLQIIGREGRRRTDSRLQQRDGRLEGHGPRVRTQPDRHRRVRECHRDRPHPRTVQAAGPHHLARHAGRRRRRRKSRPARPRRVQGDGCLPHAPPGRRPRGKARRRNHDLELHFRRLGHVPRRPVTRWRDAGAGHQRVGRCFRGIFGYQRTPPANSAGHENSRNHHRQRGVVAQR